MKVSVVITCFNYAPYLEACLRSVLAQRFTNFDVVVVDDGSTDDTAAVMRLFENEARIRYHYQANQGQAVAKNTGIRLSTGEIIAFLDADDLWMPDKLALQIPVFDNPSVGVACTGGIVIDTVGTRIPIPERKGYMRFRRGRITKWLGFENIVPFSSSAVRRSLLEQFGAFDETLGMGIDWDLWLRLSCETDFDFVPDKLFAYRYGHANQMSKNKAGRLQASDDIFRRFLAAHPGAISATDLRKVNFYNACSRAGQYRAVDIRQSNALFRRALALNPLSPKPYFGLLKNMLGAVAKPSSNV